MHRGLPSRATHVLWCLGRGKEAIIHLDGSSQNTNVNHIRFFFDAGEGFHQDDDEKFFMRTTPRLGQHSSQNARSCQESEAKLEDNRGKRPIAFSDGSPQKKTKQSDGAFPKSVPLSRLFKMGKLLHPSNDEVLELSIEEFSAEEGKWLVPFPAKISLVLSPTVALASEGQSLIWKSLKKVR